MTEIQYDESKFRELLVHVADRSENDAAFGATKLNKLLFFCDFYAYAYLGAPISGAEYQKLKNGPAPRRLLPVQQQLTREGAVEVVKKQRTIYTQKTTVAKRPADLSAFTPEQLEVVDEVLDLFERFDNSTMSDISHRVSAGWNLADEGEEIPYETALISMEPPPPAALEKGREVAQQLGW